MEKTIDAQRNQPTDTAYKYVGTLGPLVGSRVYEALAKSAEQSEAGADLVNHEPIVATTIVAEQPPATERIAVVNDEASEPTAVHLAAQVAETTAEQPFTDQLSRKQRLANARQELARWRTEGLDDSDARFQAAYEIWQAAMESRYNLQNLYDEQQLSAIFEHENSLLETIINQEQVLIDSELDLLEPDESEVQSSNRPQRVAMILGLAATAAVGLIALKDTPPEPTYRSRSVVAQAEDPVPSTTIRLYAELPVLPTTTTTTAPTTTTTAAPAPTTTHTHPERRQQVLDGDDVWTVLADCETGDGRVGAPYSVQWEYNGPSGFDGAFQFLPSTWDSLNTGYDYAWQAPPEAQVEAAKKLQARSGWGQWPSCARRMGLL